MDPHAKLSQVRPAQPAPRQPLLQPTQLNVAV